MANISIKEWQKAFNSGKYSSYDRNIQIEAGWYDWFCRDSSLRNKTYKMGNIIKDIKAGGKVDLENNYVFFKNNCPFTGPLYDDFRICDMKTGEVIFTIQIDCFRYNSKYAVFGLDSWDEPLFEAKNKKELLNYLNNK